MIDCTVGPRTRRGAVSAGDLWRRRQRLICLVAKLILVVDDSPLIRRQVRGSLVGAGFEVLEAEDGAWALVPVGPSRRARA